jgi:DNA-binding MarR family transcriptional regulator
MIADRLEAFLRVLEAAVVRGLVIPIDDVLLVRLLISIARALERVHAQALSNHGLSGAEFRVLLALFSQSGDPQSPGALCAATDLTSAHMTRISDSLFARGLITRIASTRDRRRKPLGVSLRGDALIRSIATGAFEPLRSVLGELSPSVRINLLDELKTVAQIIDHSEISAS